MNPSHPSTLKPAGSKPATQRNTEKTQPAPLSEAAMKQVVGGNATLNTNTPVKGW